MSVAREHCPCCGEGYGRADHPAVREAWAEYDRQAKARRRYLMVCARLELAKAVAHDIALAYSRELGDQLRTGQTGAEECAVYMIEASVAERLARSGA